MARRLAENQDIVFMGNIKVGPFDISAELANHMLRSVNLSGRSNADVVRPLLSGEDITGRPRNEWIIDFAPGTSEEEAALYEEPYNYTKTNVKPEREKNNRESYRRLWWLHGEPRPAMRQALKNLNRYIITVLVSKHRLFAWVDASVSPAARLIVFAREDDYFFGALHSGAHRIWALRMGARHGGERPTYNNTTCFETFPFPWPPGKEDQSDQQVQAIAEAARELVRLRDDWLNAPGLSDAELKKRTLTNLYNQRPDWLDHTHKRLDAAVFDAYGWPHDLTDDEILARLLALNLERAARQGEIVAVVEAGDDESEEG